MPKTEIRKLIRSLKSVYSGSPWYGDAIRNKTGDITPEQAFNRPLVQAHTIAELITHMIAWRRLLVKRLQGDDVFSVKQKDSFDWRRIDDIPATAWDNLLKTLDHNQQQLISELKKRDDAFLNRKVAKRKYSYRVLITGIIQHDIYHLGQIALLKKASNSQ